MAQKVHRWTRPIAHAVQCGADLLFPPVCTCCETQLDGLWDGILLCDDCRVQLGPAIRNGCPRCGALLGSEGPSFGGCSVCRGAKLQFQAAVALGDYRDNLREVVLRMKRSAEGPLATAMGNILALRRGEELVDLGVDLIVPVPMFWSRRVRRGVNSPDLVAAALGRALHVPVVRRLLIRNRNTRPQNELPPRLRFRNVRGAFRVGRGRSLTGRRVLLVDDVLTTGATCSEAARTLRQAGAAWVAAAVIARALGPNAV